MTSDLVVPLVLAALDGDAQLTTLLGGQHRIFEMGQNEMPLVPSIEFMVINDRRLENTGRVRIQFDRWAYGTAAMDAIGRRMMAVLHSETTLTLGGVVMFARHDDTRGQFDPRPGVLARSDDFIFEPAREVV